MTGRTAAVDLGPGTPVYEKVRSTDNTESLSSQA
jgi:hypothetical protein